MTGLLSSCYIFPLVATFRVLEIATFVGDPKSVLSCPKPLIRILTKHSLISFQTDLSLGNSAHKS